MHSQQKIPLCQGSGPLAFLPGAQVLTPLHQHPSPAIRRRVQKYPKICTIGRGVLVTCDKSEIRVECKRRFTCKPRVLVVERENVAGPALLSVQFAHRKRYMKAFEIGVDIGSIEVTHAFLASLPGSPTESEVGDSFLGARRFGVIPASCNFRPRTSSIAKRERSSSSRRACITRA